ncbi:unnamed protein product [Gongylonema pulchrum]|uniref:MFS domain-containing protein n=1 Tax=Gongylonema pulchrum TaxID=637853 RepID=A0A183E134_9BILA|nr:unnamed protein product [Gongylonema pulchrum]
MHCLVILRLQLGSTRVIGLSLLAAATGSGQFGYQNALHTMDYENSSYYGDFLLQSTSYHAGCFFGFIAFCFIGQLIGVRSGIRVGALLLEVTSLCSLAIVSDTARLAMIGWRFCFGISSGFFICFQTVLIDDISLDEYRLKMHALSGLAVPALYLAAVILASIEFLRSKMLLLPAAPSISMAVISSPGATVRAACIAIAISVAAALAEPPLLMPFRNSVPIGEGILLKLVTVSSVISFLTHVLMLFIVNVVERRLLIVISLAGLAACHFFFALLIHLQCGKAIYCTILLFTLVALYAVLYSIGLGIVCWSIALETAFGSTARLIQGAAHACRALTTVLLIIFIRQYKLVSYSLYALLYISKQ